MVTSCCLNLINTLTRSFCSWDLAVLCLSETGLLKPPMRQTRFWLWWWTCQVSVWENAANTTLVPAVIPRLEPFECSLSLGVFQEHHCTMSLGPDFSRVASASCVLLSFEGHGIIVFQLTLIVFLLYCRFSMAHQRSRLGSVVVERSPGMREVGGLIKKQKTLKFEVLLLCLALSTKELETVWPARSQNNGLGWDIAAYPWGGVSVG